MLLPLQAYKTYQLGGKLNELLYSPALYGVDLSGKVCNPPEVCPYASLMVDGQHKCAVWPPGMTRGWSQ
jgi:hypothetical protein